MHFPSAPQPLSTPFIFSQKLWKANRFLIISCLPASPFSLQPLPHLQGSGGVSAWACHTQCLLYCGQSKGYRTTRRLFFFFGCSLKWESSMFSRLFTSSYLIPCPTIFGPEASGSISGTQGELPWFHLLQSSQSPLYTRKASSSFMSKTSLISFLLYILRLRKKKTKQKTSDTLVLLLQCKKI